MNRIRNIPANQVAIDINGTDKNGFIQGTPDIHTYVEDQWLNVVQEELSSIVEEERPLDDEESPSDYAQVVDVINAKQQAMAFCNLQPIDTGYGSGTFNDCAGDDEYVVFVGSGGKTFSLYNDQRIHTTNLGIAQTLRGVTYLPSLDRFIAVGTAGKIYTSDDKGGSWTLRTSGTANDLFAIAWNRATGASARVVATGEDGTILYSSNGVDWDDASLASGGDLVDVGWGSSVFGGFGGTVFATGPDSNGRMWTAPQLDPSTWTMRGLVPGGESIRQIAYTRGKWIATLDDGTYMISINNFAVNSALLDDNFLANWQLIVATPEQTWVRYSLVYGLANISLSAIQWERRSTMQPASANPVGKLRVVGHRFYVPGTFETTYGSMRFWR